MPGKNLFQQGRGEPTSNFFFFWGGGGGGLELNSKIRKLTDHSYLPRQDFAQILWLKNFLPHPRSDAPDNEYRGVMTYMIHSGTE